jgi:hypothetical protein
MEARLLDYIKLVTTWVGFFRMQCYTRNQITIKKPPELGVIVLINLDSC